MSVLTREGFRAMRETAEEALRRSSNAVNVLVCAGTGCIAGGSLKVCETLKEECERRGLQVYVGLTEHSGEEKSLHIKMSGCHGFCEMGPLVHIEPLGVMYIHVKPEDCCEIVEKTVMRGEIIERLTYQRDGVSYPRQEDIPFYKKQHRVVLASCGTSDAEDLDEYIAKGGYSAFEKALFDHDAGGYLQGDLRLRPPWPRRRRLPRRAQMGERAAQRVRREVCGLQRRRGRPRRVYGSLHHGGQPPLHSGGHDDRRCGHRRYRGLYLRPRRVSAGGEAAANRHRKGHRGRSAGRRHHGQRLLLPYAHQPGRRRLRLRRGQRSHRLHRGQAGYAPRQAAPHGGSGSVGQAHGAEQRGDVRQRAAASSGRAPAGTGASAPRAAPAPRPLPSPATW